MSCPQVSGQPSEARSKDVITGSVPLLAAVRHVLKLSVLFRVNRR